jgi:hypothetical protein
MDYMGHASTKTCVRRGSYPQTVLRDISTKHLDSGRINPRMEDRQVAKEISAPFPCRLVILSTDKDRHG